MEARVVTPGSTTYTNFNKAARLANMPKVQLAHMCKARTHKVRLNGHHNHIMSYSLLSSGDRRQCLR